MLAGLASSKRTLANGGRVPRVRDGRLVDPCAAGLAGVEKGTSLEWLGGVSSPVGDMAVENLRSGMR